MKRIALFLVATVQSIYCFGQINIGAFQDEHNTMNAAGFMPCYLGDHFNKVEVGFLNPYLSLGSTFTTFKDANSFLTANQITNDMIDKSIRKLQPDDNNISVALNLSILNMAFNFSKNGKFLWTLGLGANERVEFNSLFNDNLLALAYKGNKQFAGQTINIIPRFNGLAFTEYYVSAAANFSISRNWILTPAIRLSYLSGQGSLYMGKENAITLYTEKDGRFIDFGFNYNINASLGTDSVSLNGNSFNVNDKGFKNGSGSGVGVNFALRIAPSSNLTFNLGVMDMGSIRFKKNVTNMYNHSTIHYEGQEITFDENQSISLDSLANIANPNYSHNAYSMPLPTKLMLSCNYGMGYVVQKHGGYFKHQFTGVYLQGFDNYLSATTRPYFAVGYTHSFRNVLNLGMNAGLGGITSGTFGLLASVKAGAFRFGINSNNILPLIASNSGRGADFGMLLDLAF